MGYLTKYKCSECNNIMIGDKAIVKYINHYCTKNHKHCINRAKILDLLKLEYDNSIIKDRKKVWVYLINKIENGEFDND